MKRKGILEKDLLGQTKERASPRLLTLKDAAEYLGISVWAMRERIWAGDIPVVKFPGGRKMYVDVEDLEEFIKKNKTRYL